MRRNKKQYKRFGGKHPTTEMRNIHNAYRRGDIASGQLQILRQIARDPNDPITVCITRLHELEKRITKEIVSVLRNRHES